MRLLPVILVGLVSAELAEVDPTHLAADDECKESSEHCSLNALQTKAERVVHRHQESVKYAGRRELQTGACLCVFDIDRTLTMKQGGGPCAGGAVMGVSDTAYGGGVLTLSTAAGAVSSTFCGSCHLGVVSHGDASGDGSPERSVLVEKVLSSGPYIELRASTPAAAVWSASPAVRSPLVVKSPDGLKQNDVERIVEWYESVGVLIPRSSVYFFDDRPDNVAPFKGSGFNAKQISCASRDTSMGGIVGLCGATAQEIAPVTGVHNC